MDSLGHFLKLYKDFNFFLKRQLGKLFSSQFFCPENILRNFIVIQNTDP